MIFQIKIDIKHIHAMIKYFKSYIAVIILVKNIYFKKDLGFVIIFHGQRIRICTVSKIIGQVIHVPFPNTAYGKRVCEQKRMQTKNIYGGDKTSSIWILKLNKLNILWHILTYVKSCG